MHALREQGGASAAALLRHEDGMYGSRLMYTTCDEHMGVESRKRGSGQYALVSERSRVSVVRWQCLRAREARREAQADAASEAGEAAAGG